MQQLKKWLDRYKPDAILTPDSRLVPSLRQLRLRVPQDIAVAATTIFDTSR